MTSRQRLPRLRTTNDRRRTTDKVRLQAVGVLHSMLHGLAPTRLRALGAAYPHSLLQLAKHRIVLVVAFDDGLRVGGLHCLLEKPDLARDTRHGAVKCLHVVYRLLDQLPVRCGTEEAPLSMRVVVAERNQLLMAF